MVHFSCAPCPSHRCQKQPLKSGKHRHHNKDLIVGEIFFGNKEGRDPGKLHQGSSNRAQSRERTPALPLRDRKETDVEQRDVSEKSERMILTR